MSELTKEFFEERVKSLASKKDIEGLETGILQLQHSLKELDLKVDKIDKRDKEDSNAFARDITAIQKNIKHLKSKHVN